MARIRGPAGSGLVVALLAACSGAPPSGTPVPAPTRYGIYPPRDLRGVRPQTRAERSAFTETSRHADVMAFVDSLRAMNRDVVVTSMGQTSQGREIPVVILSRPAVRTPAEAKRLNRPVVYIQGAIHGGEVEGKEALLALLRDLGRSEFRNVVDSLIILAVPIYNGDGYDAHGPQEVNRAEQNGPATVGQRANAQGLDLNRDYVKAEAPETRAALAFLRTWDPDVFLDLHTTDGSYHGYALTWAPPLNPAARFSGPFIRDTILPAVRTQLRLNERIETFPYGNFVSQDSASLGWFTYDHRPRFGTNYYGLRGRMAILSEAYSHDPFVTRVASTYAFVTETLSLLASLHEDILDVGREADRRTTAFASTPRSSPALAIRSRLTRIPRVEDMLVEEVVRTGDSVRLQAGLPPGVRRTGRTRVMRIPVYDRFEPVLEQRLPYAWIVPAEQAALLEPLRRHGLFIEQLTTAATVAVERFTIDSVARGPRPFQGHQETRLAGRWAATDSLAVSPDMFVIRAAQPLGILALYLLEPQSDDGLVTWNFLDPWLEPGARYPIVRVPERIPGALRPLAR